MEITKQLVIAGIVLAIIITATIPAATRAYTLDAKLTKSDLSPMFNLGQTFYIMKDAKVTNLPADFKATDGTLVSSSGEPNLQIYPTRVGFSGNLSYKTADGATNMASTYISSDFKKIVTAADGTTTYTLKDKFQGNEGTLVLNGPIKTASSGTIHLEGITDPKPTD